MARILAISSQVAYGPVGLTAAVPALQARGHEVLAVPTVMLSNHPGHGAPAGFRTQPADLEAILGRLRSLGVLESCAAVLTGYFASAEQAAIAAHCINAMKPDTFILVDPVIGDGDSLYVPHTVAEAIRDHLVPLATCLSPNRFELEWLTGRQAGTVDAAIIAARSLGLAEVLATSIPAGANALATLAITSGAVVNSTATQRPSVPHGTGDFLAGLYLAERLAHGPAEALPAAMAVLEKSIALSAGSAVLDIAQALYKD